MLASVHNSTGETSRGDKQALAGGTKSRHELVKTDLLIVLQQLFDLGHRGFKWGRSLPHPLFTSAFTTASLGILGCLPPGTGKKPACCISIRRSFVPLEVRACSTDASTTAGMLRAAIKTDALLRNRISASPTTEMKCAGSTPCASHNASRSAAFCSEGFMRFQSSMMGTILGSSLAARCATSISARRPMRPNCINEAICRGLCRFPVTGVFTAIQMRIYHALQIIGSSAFTRAR